ncbi:hypothetical protein KRP22_005133 [Phytophthora ramorum]|nr:hypothetical protein KRP22_12717 [Phytophthora ramorum]
MVRVASILLGLVALTTMISVAAGSSLYEVWIYYSGNSCDGTPYYSYTASDLSCTIEACVTDGNATASGVGMASVDCTSDYETSLRNAFGTSPYILVEVFSDRECETLSFAHGFFASSNCEGSPNLNTSEAAHVVARLEPDGSATLEYYRDTTCDASGLYDTYSADKYSLSTHKCDENWSKWYYIDGDDSAHPNDAASANHDNDIASYQGSKTPIIATVAMGNLHVEFSQASPANMVELGRACISLNPSDRPTAAEALYRLQVILTKEMV